MTQKETKQTKYEYLIECETESQVYDEKNRMAKTLKINTGEINCLSLGKYIVAQFTDKSIAVKCLENYTRTKRTKIISINSSRKDDNTSVISIQYLSQLMKLTQNEEEVASFMMEKHIYLHPSRERKLNKWNDVLSVLNSYGTVVDIRESVDKVYFTISNFANNVNPQEFINKNGEKIINEIVQKLSTSMRNMTKSKTNFMITQTKSQCQHQFDNYKENKKETIVFVNEQKMLENNLLKRQEEYFTQQTIEIKKIAEKMNMKSELSGFEVEFYIPMKIELSRELLMYFESYGPIERLHFNVKEKDIRIFSIVYKHKISAIKCIEENHRKDPFNCGITFFTRNKFLSDDEKKIVQQLNVMGENHSRTKPRNPKSNIPSSTQLSNRMNSKGGRKIQNNNPINPMLQKPIPNSHNHYMKDLESVHQQNSSPKQIPIPNRTDQMKLMQHSQHFPMQKQINPVSQIIPSSFENQINNFNDNQIKPMINNYYQPIQPKQQIVQPKQIIQTEIKPINPIPIIWNKNPNSNSSINQTNSNNSSKKEIQPIIPQKPIQIPSVQQQLPPPKHPETIQIVQPKIISIVPQQNEKQQQKDKKEMKEKRKPNQRDNQEERKHEYQKQQHQRQDYKRDQKKYGNKENNYEKGKDQPHNQHYSKPSQQKDNQQHNQKDMKKDIPKVSQQQQNHQSQIPTKEQNQNNQSQQYSLNYGAKTFHRSKQNPK